MDAFAWPAAVFLLGVVVIFTFRKQIGGFIDRLKRLGKWAEAAVAEIPQKTAAEEGQIPGPRQLQPPETTGGVGAPETSAVMAERAIQAWTTPMILEHERGITQEYSVITNPTDRERVLTRHLAAMRVIQWFERTHNTVFGSQLFALARLNSAGDDGLEEKELRAFYDDAVKNYPVMGETVSFDQWIGYLISAQLIMRLESGRYSITGYGHEFLIHLAKSRREVFKAF